MLLPATAEIDPAERVGTRGAPGTALAVPGAEGTLRRRECGGQVAGVVVVRDLPGPEPAELVLPDEARAVGHGMWVDVADERAAVQRRAVEPRRLRSTVVVAREAVQALAVIAAVRRPRDRGRADHRQVRVGETRVDELVVRRRVVPWRRRVRLEEAVVRAGHADVLLAVERDADDEL